MWVFTITLCLTEQGPFRPCADNHIYTLVCFCVNTGIEAAPLTVTTKKAMGGKFKMALIPPESLERGSAYLAGKSPKRLVFDCLLGVRGCKFPSGLGGAFSVPSSVGGAVAVQLVALDAEHSVHGDTRGSSDSASRWVSSFKPRRAGSALLRPAAACGECCLFFFFFSLGVRGCTSRYFVLPSVQSNAERVECRTPVLFVSSGSARMHLPFSLCRRRRSATRYEPRAGLTVPGQMSKRVSSSHRAVRDARVAGRRDR
ncbi:hypothetical protein NDU88_005477 [Pleurodeles waltl]|uniref:Uncharacterized protein n=1 Tax=Pleurodeles waltl TaxID=8319 RepID=A0AAV7W7X9_PLEWA|nr:hypothetical protein NDU88_005477 [Pleurodeles waltl]